MVRSKQLVVITVAMLTVTSFAVSAQARHRHSGHHGYSFIPTYYPGPPWYPGPAFYEPFRYGFPYGGYEDRDRHVYRPYW